MRKEVRPEYSGSDIRNDELISEVSIADGDGACCRTVARDASPVCSHELHPVGALTPLLRGRGDEGDECPPVD